MAGLVPGIHVFCGVRKQDVDAREVARILRPGGRFSSTEAAGDPDRVKRTELDAFAALAGLEKGESWSGLWVETFNYNKPRSLA